MNMTVSAANPEERQLLDALLEKYNYEFSQYDLTEWDKNGLFGYTWLGNYFDGTPERYAYIVRCDGKPAGFALINNYPECSSQPCDHAVAEFFIGYPYRRQGVGSYVMREMFARHPGTWQIKYHPRNTASVFFWNRIAKEYACGDICAVYGDEDYPDGSKAQVLCFRSR